MDVDEQVIIPIKKYNKMLNAYNKIWRKFYSNEVTDRHLKYELDIFWKFNDEKCKNKANNT